MPLIYNKIEPSGGFDSGWCVDQTEEGSNARIFYVCAAFHMILLLSGVLIFFILIIRKVHKVEALLKVAKTAHTKKKQLKCCATQSALELAVESHNNTKIVLAEALAYVSSFMITLIMPLFRSFSNEADWMLRVYVLLFPMQGFTIVLYLLVTKFTITGEFMLM